MTRGLKIAAMRKQYKGGLILLLAVLIAWTPLAPVPFSTAIAADASSAHAHSDTAVAPNEADEGAMPVALEQQACGDHGSCDGACCAACAHCLSAVFFSAVAAPWHGTVMHAAMTLRQASFIPHLLERPPQSPV